jgi:hypothetical protein
MRLRHSLFQMARFRQFWFGGVSFFCSIGEADASFYSWDHRSFMVCSGVRTAMLRDERYDILFAPYGHHLPSWERIQGYFAPTHWGICLLKMCIFYSLDCRSEYFFAPRESWPYYRGGAVIQKITLKGSTFLIKKKSFCVNIVLMLLQIYSPQYTTSSCGGR